MKSPKATVAATLLLIVLGALAAGCSTQSPSDTSISWDRPANWEGQVPGMSGGQGAPTR